MNNENDKIVKQKSHFSLLRPKYLSTVDVALVVVGLEGDMELSHLDMEELQELSLLGSQGLTLLANTVLVGEGDDSVVQDGGHAQTPELGLHVVGEDLLAAVDGAGGDNKGAGGLNTRASEIRLGVVGEKLFDLLGLSVGEEKTNVANQLLRELVEVILVLILGGSSQCLGHHLGAAEKETGGLPL